MATDIQKTPDPKYFTLKEFECPCCGLNNINSDVISKIDRIRSLMDIPLHINSGTRCPKHNTGIGGKPGSQHLIGNAIDVSMNDMDLDQRHTFLGLMHTEFNGIGIGKTFIHGDVRSRPATWIYP